MREPYLLERTQVVEAPIEEAWRFYADPGNLEAITPPWLRFQIESTPDELRRGSYLRYSLRLFGIPIRWQTVIARWHPPRSFVDVQLSGPYVVWEHTHRLSRVSGGTEIHDGVRYRLPVAALAPLSNLVVARLLAAIFDYRAERTAALLSSTS
ncbi:MAG: SRPBCC family protein [Actinobacteria bacterium]|nr:SRPBCC family protein [Actinomycetota bacterium]